MNNTDQNLTADTVVFDMMCEASYRGGADAIPSKKLMQIYAREFPQYKNDIVEMVAFLLAEKTFGEEFGAVGNREFLIVCDYLKSELSLLV